MLLCLVTYPYTDTSLLGGEDAPTLMSRYFLFGHDSRVPYKTGIKVFEREMKLLNLDKDYFHGEWNYSIKPI